VSPASCQILVLEDDPALAALVAAALREAGYCHVRTSGSIAGARQCWHAQLGKFDLFLTDFSLPDGSASDFIQELVRYKPELRVVLMTGFNEGDLGLETSSRHLTVLAKPFRPADLVGAVGSAVLQP
jgi:DNA-binding NtrC family response regulator